jgi:hypothetical protein
MPYRSSSGLSLREAITDDPRVGAALPDARIRHGPFRIAMSLVATLVEPGRVTVFFDCRDAAPDPTDQRRIEQAFECSAALARADDEVAEMALPMSLTRADLVEIVPDLRCMADLEASSDVRGALTRLADRYAAMAA